MKILIIGSEGFIGSYCTSHLKTKGYSIFGADITYNDTSFDFYLLDKNSADFQKIFQDQVFDVCINASGAASVPFSIESPMLDFELNTGNIVKILEAIRIHAPNCFFINFSSAAVYGNPEFQPVTESMKPSPMSPYGWHKYYAELICKEYATFFGIQSCNLRIFSAYGPRLKKQFFWDLFNKLKTDKELELFGTGNESRDFIYVEDIAKCVELIIDNRAHMPGIINVASGIETSISKAAQIFCDLMGTQNKIKFRGESRIGDPLNWKGDISILKSIGFNPMFTLEKGLEEYILWLRTGKK
jgi:UDP-glucose 4-epimerase